MRTQIERMPRVRAVVDIAADLIPVPHHEAAQRPGAGADGECPRAKLLQVRQATDYPLEVELRPGHRRAGSRARRTGPKAHRPRRCAATATTGATAAEC